MPRGEIAARGTFDERFSFARPQGLHDDLRLVENIGRVSSSSYGSTDSAGIECGVQDGLSTRQHLGVRETAAFDAEEQFGLPAVRGHKLDPVDLAKNDPLVAPVHTERIASRLTDRDRHSAGDRNSLDCTRLNITGPESYRPTIRGKDRVAQGALGGLGPWNRPRREAPRTTGGTSAGSPRRPSACHRVTSPAIGDTAQATGNCCRETAGPLEA